MRVPGREARPVPESITIKLAEIAHEIWCAQLIEEGWRPGPEFDERAKTHDALVPFDKLEHDDRWTAIESVAVLYLERYLQNIVKYPRGADRPLVTRDMAVGLRIESTFPPERPGDPPLRGRVVRWETHPRSNRLNLIWVRWDDGQLTEHCPLETEIRKAP